MRFFSNIRTVVFAVGVMMSLIASSDVFAAAPVVVSPYNNEVLTITGTSIYPTITGTADSGSSITVEKDGNPICTTTTDSIGTWSCLSTVAFTPGIYALTATSTLGDIKQVSSSISCVIIEHTLDTPVVVSPYNNEVLSITGASILPTITGTASPNTSIVVKKNGSPICTTTTNSLGIWSCVSTVAFTPGTYALSVTSSLGSQTKDSASISCVIIQYIPPPPPACTPPTLNTLSDLTLSCNSKTISDIYISGSGSAGATVTVTTASGVVVASSVVNGSGSWWATSSYAFASGTYTLTASATLGNVTVIGASRTFTVRPATNCGSPHITPTILPVTNSTLSCQYSSDGRTFSGSGTPGATIILRNASGASLGTSVTVGSSGTWTLAYSPFYAGSHSVRVESTLGASTLIGNTITFVVSPATNCTPSHTPPYIAPVSNIALACGTTATAISLSGTGTPGATVTVRNSSGASLMTTLVGSSGSWSGTTWSLLSVGNHTLSVSSTLGVSTVGGNTTTFSIRSPIDCGGGVLHRAPVIAPVANATLSCNTVSRSVNFSGTGTVGATITLRNASGAAIATATVVGTGGTWSVTPITGFTAGSYSITVESLYTNAILIGNTVSFSISPATDCVTHVTPVMAPVSSVTLACGQTALSMNFSGSGSSGATITLRNASGTILGTTIVATSGTWTLTPSAIFSAGSPVVTVESTLGLSTIIGNSRSFTVSGASNCGGGGGSITGPGGPSPTIIIGGTRFTSTPLYAMPTLPPIRITINPQRPLTRYELAQTLVRKSLNVRPYWQRFPAVKTPTKTFLGTGPKSLTEKTSIVTSKRVQTSDDTLTRQAQTKKTFPYPLLGN